MNPLGGPCGGTPCCGGGPGILGGGPLDWPGGGPYLGPPINCGGGGCWGGDVCVIDGDIGVDLIKS
jgi:hypothetical protein